MTAPAKPTIDEFPLTDEFIADIESGNVCDAVSEIYAKYRKAYDNELQGCCLLLADEIQRAVGGEIVAGFLTWYGGACRRSHWWVEKDGKAIDPMGDDILSYEEYPGREEAHRNESEFRNLLPRYEQWRVTA